MIDSRQIRVVRLYTSIDHNFFGHHDKAAGTHPLIEHQEIHCVAGRGIQGDRFFNHKENHRGQITFFSSEAFDEICRQLGVADKHPGLTRRNVITAGVNLNELIGVEFSVQGIQFYGVEECRPCYWMDRVIAPGAEAALRNRGGLRAKILTSGRLRAET